jgi:putative Mg2+ transporter-C (MgtC) family protein
VDSLGISDIVLRLAVAAVAGLAIGFEREQREAAAGLRTVALVSSGSAILVLSAIFAAPGEVVRMAAGVATGVGFLGAGTILRERGEVIGLTTAATVWVAAAIGIAAALGAYALAALGTALTLLVLAVLRRVDLTKVQQDARTYEVAAGVPDWDETTGATCLIEAGLSVTLLSLSWSEDRVAATWLGVGLVAEHGRALAALRECPSVVSVAVTT